MPNVSQMNYAEMQNFTIYWGSRILAAIVILVVAHFVAKAAKWGLAKIVDRLPAASHHNAHLGSGKEETVGAKVGDIAYWLVLLLGLIAALNVLELTGVVTPLNAMLVQFASYVPNIVGAGLIFFVGYLVATLAKRVVEAALAAADLDRWLSKAGLQTASGAAGIAKTVGTIVFVLIIIPVAIAALQTLGIDAISQPAIAVLTTVLNAVPNILAAAVILTLAFFIGRWVASVIETALPTLGFDRAIHSLTVVAGAKAAQEKRSATAGAQAVPGAASASGTSALAPSKIVANLVLITIMLFSAIEAARLLGFVALATMLEQILELGGRILFGGIIITLGVMIGEILSSALEGASEGSDRFAATLVKWAAIALATAMGLRFMGIANEIVTLAFGLILGAAAVAAALAFGLGGRETAGRLVDRWTRKAEQPVAKPPRGG